MICIESHVICPCGCPVTLIPGPRYRGWNWSAVCRDCYAPVEDASPTETVTGTGETAFEALDDWRECWELAHDRDMAEMQREMGAKVREMLEALERQVNAEAARQRALRLREQAEAPESNTEKQGS